MSVPGMSSTDSARSRHIHRVKHHLRRRHLAAAALPNDDPSTSLPPGDMRLLSYFTPSLEDGVYTVNVQQDIEISRYDQEAGKLKPTENMKLASTKDFEVVGPRFSLPANAVHQTYPPQGHGDHHMVLPHIVFNDPHLPWERIGSTKERIPGGTKPTNPRGLVPWLALLTCTKDELELSAAELNVSTVPPGLFPTKSMKQSPTTFAVNLPLSDILQFNASKVLTPVLPLPPEDPIPTTQPVDMIFIKPDLFMGLFASYSDGTGSMEEGKRYWSGAPDVSRYRYMSHVREINNSSTVDVGLNDVGTYGVIISHRGGPLPGPKRAIVTNSRGDTLQPAPTSTNIILPTAVQVHLVSLVDVEKMVVNETNLPARFGLVSLYSWTYTCLPPDRESFLDQMRIIGSEIPNYSWLCPPDSVINKIQLGDKTGHLRDRISDGYTILKWKPKTGEDTIAFTRGPLVPTLPADPVVSNDAWRKHVNHSSSLQILDPKLGIMDISYATAWELGKTLAIADRAFSAALVRLRRSATVKAMQEARKTTIPRDFRGHYEVLSDLPESVKSLHHLPNGTATPSRNNAHCTLDHRYGYHQNVFVAMKALASSPRGHIAPNTSGDVPYNEVNVPASTDWALVMKWILDKLYLYNLPAHYLLTNPTNLPSESIRLFYIDHNWLDWLVDGALSIGNHLDRDYDSVREAIKDQMNQYFRDVVHDQYYPHRPQIPTFGFMLRSKIVEQTPDLQVKCAWPDAKDPRSETLRVERLDKDLLFCLFDRLPGSGDFVDDQSADSYGIQISQPPHQQRYTAGVNNSLDPATKKNRIEVEFRKVFTASNIASGDRNSMTLDNRCWEEGTGEVIPFLPMPDPLNPNKQPTPPGALKVPNPKAIFDWDLNALIPEQFGKACNNILQQELGDDMYKDYEPNAACIGIQLNDPMLKLVIRTPQQNPPPNQSYRQFPLDLPVPPVMQPVPPRPPFQGRPAAALHMPAVETSSPPSSPWTITITPKPSTSAPMVFDYHFYPCGKLRGESGNTLSIEANSIRTDLPVDLLVRVVRKASARKVQLQQVMLQFPTGDNARFPPLVKPFHNSTGWGAGMVNNHRFNVLTSQDSEGHFLQCSLFPRSAGTGDWAVELDTVSELTFVLNGISLDSNILIKDRTCKVFASEMLLDETGRQYTPTIELWVAISTSGV